MGNSISGPCCGHGDSIQKTNEQTDHILVVDSYSKHDVMPLPPSLSANGLEEGGILFEVILKKRDGVPLGIDVDHSNDRRLLVEAVHAGGLVEEWNTMSTRYDLRVMPGDYVTAVNRAINSQSMIEECQSAPVLRIQVVRYRELAGS